MTIQRRLQQAIDAMVFDEDISQLSKILDEHPTLVKEAEERHGFTLLHVAADLGRADRIPLLLERGCRVNARNSLGKTPLYYSLKGRTVGGEEAERSKKAIELLLVAGADPNAKSNDNLTPLFEAVRDGDDDVVQMFLQHGAVLDLNSALYLLTVEEIQERLDANPDAVKDQALVPNGLLSVAVGVSKWRKRPDGPDRSRRLVKLLLERGADPNADAKPFGQPLICSLYMGVPGLGLARMLLENGADPNVKDRFGISALRLAENSVRMLAKHGRADVEVPDQFAILLKSFGAKK